MMRKYGVCIDLVCILSTGYRIRLRRSAPRMDGTAVRGHFRSQTQRSVHEFFRRIASSGAPQLENAALLQIETLRIRRQTGGQMSVRVVAGSPFPTAGQSPFHALLPGAAHRIASALQVFPAGRPSVLPLQGQVHRGQRRRPPGNHLLRRGVQSRRPTIAGQSMILYQFDPIVCS